MNQQPVQISSTMAPAEKSRSLRPPDFVLARGLAALITDKLLNGGLGASHCSRRIRFFRLQRDHHPDWSSKYH
jgi:hypothetical protein